MNASRIYTERIDAIADKWFRLCEDVDEGSASVNLNHDIYAREMDLTNVEDLEKGEKRIDKYWKMKANQARSSNNLKSSRQFDANET